MQSVIASQLGQFLADLRFVACLCALVLYGAWIGTQRHGLVGMARLGLVVAFGATIVAYGLTLVPVQSLPFTDFYLFVLLALFLILEFLFHMSVLGVFVSVVGTAISSLQYWWHLAANPRVPFSSVQAYWWLLRDLTATTGVAALTLGLGTGVLLCLQPDRRPGGKLVHPNDLRDVAALLARGAAPCLFFALGFEVVAIFHGGRPTWADAWSMGWLTSLFMGSVAWWLEAERRRFVGPRVLGLIAANVVALAAYSAERLIFSDVAGGLR